MCQRMCARQNNRCSGAECEKVRGQRTPGSTALTCLWRIDMFTDPTGDRAAQVRRVTLTKQQLVAVKGSDQPTRAAFTSSNSDWVHGRCSLSMSAGYSGEHDSSENQAAIGV